MKKTKKIILFVFWASLTVFTILLILSIWNIGGGEITKKFLATSVVTMCVSFLSLILIKRL